MASKAKDDKHLHLRKEAEAILHGRPVSLEDLSLEDTKMLIHELQVYQLELELQNEELRHTQQALEESRNQYRHLYDFAPVGYFTLSPKHDILEVNQAGVQMLKSVHRRLVGRPFSRFVPAGHRETFYQHLDDVFNKKTLQRCELRLIRQDGAQFDAQLQSISIVDEHGQITQARVTLSDITDRKKLEEQLRHSQKMEAVGHLAGGVAHHFNNMLTVIMGYIDLSMKALPADHPVTANLTSIQETTDRASFLTQELLTFTRRQIAQPRVCNLNDLIADMKNILFQFVRENISLTSNLAPDLFPIQIDPNQFEQLLVNLIINARDAMPQGGQLVIETANEAFSHTHPAPFEYDTHSQYVRLSVSDTGIGMTEAVKRRIFEPFFTTKEVGQGTGLGLSTCFGIVQQHGGYITVESAPQMGATFNIYFPSVRRKEAEPVALSSETPSEQGSETILIVEDEPGVRQVATLVLKRQGYIVLEAKNGREALDLIDKRQELPLHLLLTDVVMPYLGGTVLAEQLKERYPHLKVLYTSGYSEALIRRANHHIKDGAFLAKPFNPNILLQTVRSLLDGQLNET